MGGGASGLNDGFIKHGLIKYICYHHEQGAGHSAIGESKFTGQIAVVNPTTGCGGTNCATSVLDAWQDSTPILFVSGNVASHNCSSYINQKYNLRLRKYGIQEHDIISSVKSMTKMAEFIVDPADVPYMIQKAVYTALDGRPGPVWIDIPNNIQTALMPENFRIFDPSELPKTKQQHVELDSVKTCLKTYQRPLVLAGFGIKQANAVDQFVSFIDQYQIPYVSTYGARDYMEFSNPLNIGAVGIKGSRAGNFAMQNADLLLILGSSLGSSVIGYDPLQFSPHSFKILVDCDISELNKPTITIDKKYHLDLKDFFKEML
jgi:acetolactate synthase-1/2/3 large subunit